MVVEGLRAGISWEAQTRMTTFPPPCRHPWITPHVWSYPRVAVCFSYEIPRSATLATLATLFPRSFFSTREISVGGYGASLARYARVRARGSIGYGGEGGEGGEGGGTDENMKTRPIQHMLIGRRQRARGITSRGTPVAKANTQGRDHGLVLRAPGGKRC